jgi:hypothetical protein
VHCYQYYRYRSESLVGTFVTSPRLLVIHKYMNNGMSRNISVLSVPDVGHSLIINRKSLS